PSQRPTHGSPLLPRSAHGTVRLLFFVRHFIAVEQTRPELGLCRLPSRHETNSRSSTTYLRIGFSSPVIRSTLHRSTAKVSAMQLKRSPTKSTGRKAVVSASSPDNVERARALN